MKFYTSINRDGRDLVIRGYEDGERYEERVEYRPFLFSPSRDISEFKTLHGEYLRKVPYENMTLAGAATKNNVLKTYGQSRWPYQYINDNWSGDVVPYRAELLRVGFIDIETETELGFPNVNDPQERISLISILLNGEMNVFGIKAWENTGKTKFDFPVHYHHYDDESLMLRAFMNFWRKADIDIVTGWNTCYFDLPYIYNRISKVCGKDFADRLSPVDNVSIKEVMVNNRPAIKVVIDGIAGFDYLDLYKKFTYGLKPSYKLDYIAEIELGQKKLDYSEHDNFKEFYTKDWNRFVDYNIVDTSLIQKLDTKLRFINLAHSMTYYSKALLEDVFSPVRLWDTMVYNRLLLDGVILPIHETGKSDSGFAGAYVSEPVRGRHEWIINYDVSSMYPHIIEQWGISPENIDESEWNSPAILDEVFGDKEQLIDGRSDENFDEPEPSTFPLVSNRSGQRASDVLLKLLIEKKVPTQIFKDNGVSLTGNGVLLKSKSGYLGKMAMEVFKQRAAIVKEQEAKAAELEKIEQILKARKGESK